MERKLIHKILFDVSTICDINQSKTFRKSLTSVTKHFVLELGPLLLQVHFQSFLTLMVSGRDLALQALQDPKNQRTQSGERGGAFPIENEVRGIIGRPLLSFKQLNNTSLIVYNTTYGQFLVSGSTEIHEKVTQENNFDK